jgi:hypothetical protein
MHDRRKSDEFIPIRIVAGSLGGVCDSNHEEV